MNPLNYMRLHDHSSRNPRQHWTNASNGKISIEFTKVRAPINGRISRYFVSIGNLISGGTTVQSTLLTTIVSLDPIYCYFEADERSYLKGIRQLRNGDRTNGRASRQPVYVALADEENFPHQG